MITREATGLERTTRGTEAGPKISSDDANPATPRSTYSKASSDAKRAVQDSKSGKGSARSMLHKHVSSFDFSSSKSPGKSPHK